VFTAEMVKTGEKDNLIEIGTALILTASAAGILLCLKRHRKAQ